MYKFSKIWNIVTTALVAMTVLLALVLAGPRLLGWQIYTVLSGSMEPTFRTGSVIYVAQTETDQLAPGDVITYYMGPTLTATHRIVRITEDEAGVGYITKGDANESEDGTVVRPGDVIGSPVLAIPVLGYFAAFIQQPPGSVIALLVALGVLMMILLPDFLTGKDEYTLRCPETRGIVAPDREQGKEIQMKKKLIFIAACILILEYEGSIYMVMGKCFDRIENKEMISHETEWENFCFSNSLCSPSCFFRVREE